MPYKKLKTCRRHSNFMVLTEKRCQESFHILKNLACNNVNHHPCSNFTHKTMAQTQKESFGYNNNKPTISTQFLTKTDLKTTPQTNPEPQRIFTKNPPLQQSSQKLPMLPKAFEARTQHRTATHTPKHLVVNSEHRVNRYVTITGAVVAQGVYAPGVDRSCPDLAEVAERMMGSARRRNGAGGRG